MNITLPLKRIFGPSKPNLPFTARHVEYSVIASADDDARPDDYLLQVGLQAAEAARSVSVADVVARMPSPPFWPEVWPGEHYKLLAALIDNLRPKTVVEIGTFTGLSALTMSARLSEGACLHTFDILPWNSFSDTVLRAEDFSDGRLKQILGDVGSPDTMRQHTELFREADLFFVDGPKDGKFEQKFLDLLNTIELPKKPLFIFDDIRVWNMLAIWRHIAKPKLDLTSFGHWSGTGLVHWV